MNLKTGVIIYLLTIMLLGCSAGSGTQLSGKYQGPAGTLEFLPESQVKVDFNDDYAWLIEWAPKGKNHAIYNYTFTDAQGQKVAMDKAVKIMYTKDKQYIHTNKIKVEPGKITFVERLLKEDGVMTKI